MTTAVRPPGGYSFRVAPPGLGGASLVVWGVQTGQPILGCLAATGLEVGRHLAPRWELTLEDWVRLIDLVIVLVVGSIAVAVIQEKDSWLWQTLRLLPVLTLVLPLAQGLSADGVCRVRPSLRPFRKPTDPVVPGIPFEISNIHIILCVVSGGAEANPGRLAIAASGLILAWLLWSSRAPGWPTPRVAVSIGLAGALTVALAASLGGTDVRLQRWALDLLRGWLPGAADLRRVDTALGRIGPLTLSDRIVLRVAAAGVPPGGMRLILGTYGVFSSASWFAPEGVDHLVTADRGEAIARVWRLAPDLATLPDTSIRITAWLDQRKTLVPLPPGTVAVRGLAAQAMTVAPGGGVLAEGVASPVRFEALMGPGAPPAAPPGPDDLLLSAVDAPLFRNLAAELELYRLPPTRRVNAIGDFFASPDFQYSVANEIPVGANPLAHFLRVGRQGHCEYYATATVLLLRAAGIPARYVLGYSVHERDPWEGDYLVRQRHGHAWAEAFVDGGWQTIDTTPAGWPEADRGMMRAWRLLPDLWAWLSYRLYQWLDSPDGIAFKGSLRWLLIPALLFLGRRLWSALGRRRAQVTSREGRRSSAREAQTIDGFARIELHLARHGWHRQRHEPILRWLTTLSPDRIPGHHDLVGIAALYYQVRFATDAGAPDSAPDLEQRIERWLESANRLPE